MEISKKDFLNEEASDGIVIINVRDDFQIFKKKLLKIFGEAFGEIFNDLELIKNDDTYDVIIRQKNIPDDELIKFKYTIMAHYLMELELAVTITSYRHKLKNPTDKKGEKQMTFFEKELNKCTEIFDNKKFIGNAMYIKLGENNRLKIQFATGVVADNYCYLKLTALDKNSGTIDTALLKFRDVWDVENTVGYSKSPHIWKDGGKLSWYGYQPTPRDYEILTEKIEDYYDLFVEEQTQGFEMSQSM